MFNQDIENYKFFLQKLQTENDIKPVLNDIKNLLDFKPASDTKATLISVGLSNIIRCLEYEDKSNVDLACEVLKICFEKFGVGDVVKHFIGHIMYLLRHEKDCVRSLAIEEVYKSVTTDISLLPVPQYIDLFVAISHMVCDTDIGVANKAVIITSNLPFEAYPKVLEEMKIALEHNSSSKCNAYEVVINISLKSHELFKLCIDHGYIGYMVGELKSSDILYQLNILELLSRLAIKPYAIQYLVKEGDLNKISALIGDLHINPLLGLLIPGYMKFFGSIAHYYPKEIFDKYPILLQCLFDAIDTGDETILPGALDTLGFIGKKTEGKLCLAAVASQFLMTKVNLNPMSTGGQFICAVEKVGKLVKNSTSQIRIRAALCLSNLISVDMDEKKTRPVDHRVTLMTREWFRTINRETGSMETLFNMCKNPFPDIKLAGLSLLDAVCQHLWGEKEVARVAGFIEYLLDRSASESKEEKEAKYDIIKRLSQSSAFDDNILSRLQAYVEEGPFYSDTVLEVAMEEGE